jgi:hypothetical protein
MASRYDMVRNRINQDASSERQQTDTALARKFARMGQGLNSGAYVRASQQATDDANNRKAKSLEDVDFQEQGEQEQLAEAERQRAFAKSEREGSQTWQSGENATNRAYSTSERLGSQDFSRAERIGSQDWQSHQADLAQAFAKSERIGSQDWQAGQAGEARTFATGEREAGQKFAGDQAVQARGWQESDNTWNRQFAGQQFQEEKEVNEANRQAQLRAGEKSGIEAFQPWNDVYGKSGLGSGKTGSFMNRVTGFSKIRSGRIF